MAFQELAAAHRRRPGRRGERLAVVVADGERGRTSRPALDEPGGHGRRLQGRAPPAGRRPSPRRPRAPRRRRRRRDARPPGDARAVRGRADRPASHLATVVVPAPGATGDLVRRRRSGRTRPHHPARAARLAAADVVVWAASLVPEAVLDHCRPEAELHDSKGDDARGGHRRLRTPPRRRDRAAAFGRPDRLLGDRPSRSAWCIAHERAFEIVPGVGSLAAAAAAAPAASSPCPRLAQSVVLTRLADRTAASMPDGEGVAPYARRRRPRWPCSSRRPGPRHCRPSSSRAGSAYSARHPGGDGVTGCRGPTSSSCARRSARWPPTSSALGRTTTVLVLVGDALAGTIRPAATSTRRLRALVPGGHS